LSLLLFGHGHPAIDFLLLLAVASDGVGMIVIAVFYTDPAHPVKAKYLGLVVLAMFLAFCLRKFHYRKEHATHQTWFLYVAVSFLAWLGLLWAHMHPALALVFVVPFMPGPTYKALEHFDEEVEAAMEDLALGNGDREIEKAEADGQHGEGAEPTGPHEADGVERPEVLVPPCRISSSKTSMTAKAKAIHAHHEFSRGRGVSIQGELPPWIDTHLFCLLTICIDRSEYVCRARRPPRRRLAQGPRVRR
jgi:hypothetical protein